MAANVKTFEIINHTFIPEMNKRLFAAIKIDTSEELLNVYYSIRHRLKDEKIKWVEPMNFHLTLKFFGETPGSQIEKINNELERISDDIEPFAMTISKAGIFGSSYNPRVIWLGFKEEELLKNIGTKILSHLNDKGFPSDRQNFVPHLTIARIKKIDHIESLRRTISHFQTIQQPQIKINSFHLYESILKPAGPVYLLLSSYSLSSEKA